MEILLHESSQIWACPGFFMGYFTPNCFHLVYKIFSFVNITLSHVLNDNLLKQNTNELYQHIAQSIGLSAYINWSTMLYDMKMHRCY